MMQPPRSAERVLESLGANADLHDAVLGDLAEEFATRVEWDGASAARRWYYAQAVRAIPFLLRSWLRQAQRGDLSRLFGIVATSYIGLLLIGGAVGVVGAAVMSMFGTPSFDFRNRIQTGDPAIFTVLLAVGLTNSMLGGYIAAWIDDKTPLISALSFGVFWAAVQIVLPMITGVGPYWYRALIPAALIVGAFSGGVMRVLRAKPWSKVAV
jgi:hypothetical protein